MFTFISDKQRAYLIPPLVVSMLYLPRVLAVTFARGDPGATSSRTSGPTVPFSPVPIYGFRPLANLHALLIEAPLKMNI